MRGACSKWGNSNKCNSNNSLCKVIPLLLILGIVLVGQGILGNFVPIVARASPLLWGHGNVLAELVIQGSFVQNVVLLNL